MQLISSLFDFSFSTFVTTKFVRFIYALLLLANVVSALAVLVMTFPFGLLLGPVVFLLLTAFARVGLEVTIVLFRIAENVQKVAETESHRAIALSDTRTIGADA